MGDGGTIERLAAIIGEPATLKLVAAFGGTRIRLPLKVTADRAIAQAIGLAAARKLVEEMGDGEIDVPTGKGHGHGMRISRRKLQELRDQGMSIAQCARALSCTERQLYNILGRREDERQHSFLDLLAG